MDDHPVFRPLVKCVVYNSDGWPAIKTCMGMRYRTAKVKRGRYGEQEEEHEYEVIYWDDGTTTTWDEKMTHSTPKPRPLREEEYWVQEAIDQFRSLLAGQIKQFTIHFQGGSKFVGQVYPPDKDTHTIGGIYFAAVTMDNDERKEGIFEYEPSTEHPTVEDFLRHNQVRTVHQLHWQEEGDNTKKRWAGVFLPVS